MLSNSAGHQQYCEVDGTLSRLHSRHWWGCPKPIRAINDWGLLIAGFALLTLCVPRKLHENTVWVVNPALPCFSTQQMLFHPLEIRQGSCAVWEAALSGQFQSDLAGRQIGGHFPWLAAFNASPVRAVSALWTALAGRLPKSFHTPHLASLQPEVEGGRVQEECASKGDLSPAVKFSCCRKIFHSDLVDSSAFSASRRAPVHTGWPGRLSRQIIFRLESVHLMDVKETVMSEKNTRQLLHWLD